MSCYMVGIRNKGKMLKILYTNDYVISDKNNSQCFNMDGIWLYKNKTTLYIRWWPIGMSQNASEFVDSLY